MLPWRSLVLLLAVLAPAACARQAPRTAAVPAAPVAASDLDARIYGAPQAAAYAQAPAETVRRARRVVAAGGAERAEDGPYRLDSGDRLRVVVFGQDALSNNYLVDADGAVHLPLIGAVPARGLTTTQLSNAIAGRLKQSYLRDPSVAVEIATHRPFFVLGEVTYPGQYPYVPNMTVENAVAIAGGFTPRAAKDRVTLTRKRQGRPVRTAMPLQSPLRPGDTVAVAERWF
jgi:polysaccharide export outer membrane protein